MLYGFVNDQVVHFSNNTSYYDS